ncbi:MULTISPECIES: hypothetical protein [unclassified Kitasatospora]|uniref:hypothetical protein n=1 Tax=unclassified Kitasatospora TaxID=2633591 RepID=UPI00070A1FB6|nr:MULTISPECIES: hypothetical protein [unclassified Kitasatospora]KQV20062.1 hypothetical protein ASC99_21965 [Kitasatospora sp. Root107]KRB71209.1 hypothetical protein ASE03_24595 [Kitasatospora sp. Root187]
MPTLPWTVPNPPAKHADALIMASRFEVRSLKDVPRFFLNSLAAWRQVRHAPGAFGASLIARPLQRTFLTLSAWDNRASLAAYRDTDPHSRIVTAMRPTMKQSTFVFWTTSADSLPISWTEAERRLDEEATRKEERNASPGRELRSDHR